MGSLRDALFPQGPRRPTRSCRIMDDPALSSRLDQDRAAVREWVLREQPWRRDVKAPAEMPDDPFLDE